MAAAFIPTAAFAFCTFAAVAWLTRGADRRRHLLVNGVPGVGTVRGLSDTNVIVNGRPVLRLDMRVEVAGGAPYDVETSVVVPGAAVDLLRPGARVAVRVDSTSPTTIAVDLSQLSATRAAAT